jgi:hypothetical protein
MEREYTAGAPRDQFLPTVQRVRAVYSHNVLEPTVEYQFGREDRILLYCRNNTYQTENPSAENSQEAFAFGVGPR